MTARKDYQVYFGYSRKIESKLESCYNYYADMAELEDAEDLKSSDFGSCRFKPHYPYCIINMTSESVQK